MSDLLIGTRRPRLSGSPRALGIIALLTTIAAAVSYVLFLQLTTYNNVAGRMPTGPVTATSDGRLALGAASLQLVGAVRVVRLSGPPFELGAARGRLQAEAAARVFTTLDGPLDRSVTRNSWLARRLHESRMRWRFRALDDSIPNQQRAELAGLVRGVDQTLGTDISFTDAMRRAAVLDVGVAAAGPDRFTPAVSRTLTIVSPVRDDAGHRLLIGRSFDLIGARDGGDSAREAVTLAIVRPQGAIPFASVQWPGTVGVVSGMNARGLAVMVHPALISELDPTRGGRPVALIARDVLEHASTLNEAVAMIEATEPIGAAAFVVVDGAARTWAVIERAPKQTATIRAPTSPVIGDVLAAAPFADDAINDRARRVRPSVKRVARAAELVRASPPKSAAHMANVLRDRRGHGGRALALGHRAAVDDLAAVHTAVFDASRRIVWVAETGTANGRMHAFDLRHELTDEPLAPAMDIPAATELDRGRTVAVGQARRYIRRAQRARATNDLQDAYELAEWALAHAPDLPAALRLAGDLAHERGDRQKARAHYRAYLQGHAEDRGAINAIHALVTAP